MWKQLPKRWFKFFSIKKPLIYLLFGPLLMMLTMMIDRSSWSEFLLLFLSFFVVMVWVILWRYPIKGVFATLVVCLFCFVIHYLIQMRASMIWKMGWGCALILGLITLLFSIREWNHFYSQQKQKEEERVSQLKFALHALCEESSEKELDLNGQIERLTEQCCSLQNRIKSMLSLVESSHLESEKISQHNEALLEKSLVQHREIKRMKREIHTLMEANPILHDTHIDSSSLAQENLYALNEKRLSSYPLNLGVENHGKLQCVHASFTSKKRAKTSSFKEQTAPFTSLSNDEKQKNLLQILGKERAVAKATYVQITQDCLSLKKVLEGGRVKEVGVIDKIKMQMIEKQQKLERVKVELIDIERKIFAIKKECQERGAFVH